jgi:cytochrome c-type biogenesis protein CcmH/NrfG
VETRKQGIGWRVIIAVVAIVLVVILAYPLLQPQSQTERPFVSPITTSPQVQDPLTGPEATAQADPASAQAQFELGNSYVNAGQWQMALAAYQKTVELDPN